MNPTKNTSRRWLNSLASIVVLLVVVGSGAYVLTDDEVAAETTIYDPASALPGDVLAHISYDGASASKNCRQLALAELWEEKQVQQFVSPLIESMNGMIEEMSKQMSEDTGLTMDDLSALGKSHTTVTVVDFKMEENGPPMVDVIATLDLGSNNEVLGRLQAAVERLLKEEAHAEIKMINLGGVMVRGCTIDDTFDSMWTAMGSHLIMGTQVKSMTDVLTRMKAKTSAGGLTENVGYAAARAKTAPNKEPVVFVHANVKKIVAAVKSIEPDDEDIAAFTEVFGLDQIGDYSYAINFEGRAVVDRIWMSTPNGQSGIMALMKPSDQSLATLNLAPKDSFFYEGVSMDLSGMIEYLLEAFAKFEPRGHEEVMGMVDELNKNLGFSLLDDLLPNLGNEWSVWMGKAPYGSLIPEIIFTAGVKDATKVNGCMAKAKEKFGKDALVRSFNFMGRDLHFADLGKIISPNEVGFGLKPCWMIDGDNMLVALAPQTLKNYIASKSSQRESLASNLDVRNAMAHMKQYNPSGGNLAVVYLDIASLVTMLADTASPVLQSMHFPQEAMQGMNIDFNMFPTGDVIRRHFFGFTAASTVTDAGVMSEMHSPFGYLGMIMGIAVPVGAATFVAESASSSDDIDWEELEPVEIEEEPIKKKPIKKEGKKAEIK